MRNSRLVAMGLVASAIGLFGTVGCSGESDTIVTAPPNKDAGSDADADTGKPDGDADADVDTGPPCPSLSFVEPTDGAQFVETDDADGDLCVNGFQRNVAVATTADDGSVLTLFGNAGKIADTTVDSGVARFDMVQLPSNGSETLRVELAGTACTAEITVSVACAGAPTCEITKPTITATHPKLNGVAVANGGDRVSAPGSPYQVAFEVKSSVMDGQPVILNVDGNMSAVSSNAVGGVAAFPGVTLTPDGDHIVRARCISKAGIEGQSTATTYTVDTEAPPLASKKVLENGVVSDLQDGDHWNPADDADPATAGLQLRICGTTDKATAPDALDLPASLGAGQQNFCVAIGTSSPDCAPATTGGAGAAGDGSCVNIDCPGGGPFNLTLTLRDDAGNPTTKTIQGVTCASQLPQVQFLSPVGDGPPWNDIDKRILAASMAGQVQRVDKDPSAPGAQYDVIACTNAPTGTAELSTGLSGGSLSTAGTSLVATDAAGLCAGTGLPSIVKFSDVRLPESSETSSGDLLVSTALSITVTDPSNGIGTQSIDIWVDSEPPSIGPNSPNPLCGKAYQSATPVSQQVFLLTTSVPVQVAISNTAGTQTQTIPNFSQPGQVNVGQVTFELGTNDFSATATERSGNIGALESPCSIMVGNPPIVTWQTPTTGARLAAASTSGVGVIADADGVAPQWQGALTVCTNIDPAAFPGATVQFSNSITGNIGAPVPLDASGCATFANADLPESSSLSVTATTSSIMGQTGSASIIVPVDVTVPESVNSLAVSVLDRRQTTFHMSWKAPNDGGKAAAGYQVRFAKAPILTEADFSAGGAVVFSGTPAAPGADDGINVANLFIENDYYFAVRAIDIAGNRGPMATLGPRRANFNTATLASQNPESYGFAVDGSSSINGDGLSDLVVGSLLGNRVDLYFGNAAGFPTVPSVAITGAAVRFGMGAAVVGDIDKDGYPDIAVGSPLAGNGRVYIFKGRSVWPASLSHTVADYVIDASAAFAGSFFGVPIVRLGDFDGDGVDDFAIGARNFSTQRGRVVIVYGSTSFSSFDLTTGLGTRALAIDGEDGTGQFGFNLIGLGQFYSGTSGTSLVVSAPNRDSLTGRVYAFRGRSASATPLFASSADHFHDPGVPGASFGYSFGLLGSSASLPFVAVGAPKPNSTGGFVTVHTGGNTTGPFATGLATITNAAASAPNNRFGAVVIGGRISGTNLTTSFIGSSAPDIAISSFAEGANAPMLYIVDGQSVGSAGAQDVGMIAAVAVRLPTDWNAPSYSVGPIRDLDGDGYGDIAIGELATTAIINGRVIVLW